MKNIHFFLLFLIIILFFSCQSKSLDIGIAAGYLPSADWLEKGVVNKYYSHYKKNDSHDTSTDIEYRAYRLGHNQELLHNYFDPAFKLVIAKTFSFQKNQMILSNEKRYFRNDTLTTQIKQPVFKDWANQSTQSEKILITSWGSRTWKNNQLSIKDTIVNTQPAKIFNRQLTYQQVYQEDSTTNKMSVKEIYVQDLGLFYLEIIDQESRTVIELVEQIPLEEFQKRANHNRHRVAYINPQETMDKGTTFKACGVNNYIYDYYNGQADYHYKGGKKEMWKVISENLTVEKLVKESGYLTFRFVVNCKGESGHFVTEQADLNYQKKQFPKEVVQHFFEITKMLKGWNPTQVRKESVDAYFYLTFKLKDGELIDILP